MIKYLAVNYIICKNIKLSLKNPISHVTSHVATTTHLIIYNTSHATAILPIILSQHQNLSVSHLETIIKRKIGNKESRKFKEQKIKLANCIA